MFGFINKCNNDCLQVVSMSEELRRALYSSNSLTSLDLEAFLPEVIGTSEIITDNVRKVRLVRSHSNSCPWLIFINLYYIFVRYRLTINNPA